MPENKTATFRRRAESEGEATLEEARGWAEEAAGAAPCMF